MPKHLLMEYVKTHISSLKKKLVKINGNHYKDQYKKNYTQDFSAATEHTEIQTGRITQKVLAEDLGFESKRRFLVLLFLFLFDCNVLLNFEVLLGPFQVLVS